MEDAEMIYNPDADPLSEIQEAFEATYMDRPGVLGVGMGGDAIGDDAIVVYLESVAAKAGLPVSFRGMEVLFEVVGEIRADDLPEF